MEFELSTPIPFSLPITIMFHIYIYIYIKMKRSANDIKYGFFLLSLFHISVPTSK